MKETNFMLFTCKKFLSLKQTFDVKMDEMKVQQVTETKFLGVIITESASWDSHIKTTRNKVSKAIGIICKNRKNMPCTILRNLYFTLIHPYLDYCNVIWAGNRTESLERLYRLQKQRAIRVITSSKWNCHTAPLFVKLYVLTLYNINKY